MFRKEPWRNQRRPDNKLVKADFSTPLENQRDDNAFAEKAKSLEQNYRTQHYRDQRHQSTHVSGEAKTGAKKDMVGDYVGVQSRRNTPIAGSGLGPDSRRQYRLDEGGR